MSRLVSRRAGIVAGLMTVTLTVSWAILHHPSDRHPRPEVCRVDSTPVPHGTFNVVVCD